MHLRVRYYREADIRADYASQLSRGGLLVRIGSHDELAQFQNIRLELAAGPSVIVLDAQVVQVFPIAGVAVTFAPSRALGAWVEAASAIASGNGGVEHEMVLGQDEAPGDKPRNAALEASQKMTLALRGDRDDRAAVLRENNPALHSQVLKNPGLQLDEVAAIAKMRTVAPDLLKQIADRREWAQRPEIAVALVRNPKTPVPVAIRLLDHVPATELRQLAKDQHTRTPIQHAARKKVIG